MLALSRGAADPEALANEGGSVALVLLLPALALFVAAALFARIFVPALKALSRPAARLSDVRLRLPLLALARNPGRAAIAASFLVVSVGGALFALTYRATLERGVEDRVHYAYPLDFVVRENLARENAAPLDVAPLSRYGALGEDVVVVPAIRRHASLPRLAGVQTLTALALPAAQLPTLSGWRDDFSELPRSEIARRLAPPRSGGAAGRPPPKRRDGSRLPGTGARGRRRPGGEHPECRGRLHHRRARRGRRRGRPSWSRSSRRRRAVASSSR